MDIAGREILFRDRASHLLAFLYRNSPLFSVLCVNFVPRISLPKSPLGGGKKRDPGKEVVYVFANHPRLSETRNHAFMRVLNRPFLSLILIGYQQNNRFDVTEHAASAGFEDDLFAANARRVKQESEKLKGVCFRWLNVLTL